MLHKHFSLLRARSAFEKLLIVSHAGDLGITKFAVLQYSVIARKTFLALPGSYKYLIMSIQVRSYTPCFREDLAQSQARMDLTSLIAMELTSGISWIISALGSLLYLKTKFFAESYWQRPNIIILKESLMRLVSWKQEPRRILCASHQSPGYPIDEIEV